VFVGLGLYNEKDVSLRGIQEMKIADQIFAELYTSLMPALSIEKLEKKVGKKISVVSRRVLEEDEQLIIREAKKGKVILLVPGDPLIATTHIHLRIHAEKEGIKTRVVHGASIISAVIGLSGLQNYKYGRSVTIPFSRQGFISETPYLVIKQNKELGSHTLCFLDINAEDESYMTIKQGLQLLLKVEKRKRQRVLTSRTLAIGVARAGSDNPVVKADYIKKLVNYDFGAPPHTLVFPGKLHFMEADALASLAGAPKEIVETS
jgi:diphthine synthase